MKLIDTTVAVDHLRGHEDATNLLLELISSGETVAASEVVRFELLAGARDEEIEALDSFFSALAWAPIGEEVSRVAAGLARRYRKSHGGPMTSTTSLARPP